MIKAVIFDWDGTLADTQRIVVNSFQEVLNRIECKVDDDEIVKRIGIGTKKTFEQILDQCKIEFNELFLENLSQEKIIIHANQTQAVHLFEGTEELLKKLKGKVKIALATMSNRIVIEKVLQEKKIKNYFDVVITADEISKPKPDPEIFLKSAAKLEVKIKDCLVIEDSIFGVRSAKSAKMRCIAVTSGAYNQFELKKEKPDLIINSIKNIEKILTLIINDNSINKSTK